VFGHELTSLLDSEIRRARFAVLLAHEFNPQINDFDGVAGWGLRLGVLGERGHRRGGLGLRSLGLGLDRDWAV
jgi:hypothetical protein